MSNAVERLGRNVRRAERLKTKIEMLPTLKRNIPLTEPMSEEQILQMDNASLSILEEVGVEFHSVNPSIDRPTPEVGSPRNPWEGCDMRNRQSTKSISTPSSGSWHVPLGTRRMQSFCYILAGLRLKVWCAGHTSCLAEIARLRRRSTHRENKAARIA